MRKFPPQEYYITMVTEKGSQFNIVAHNFLIFCISICSRQLHYLEPKNFNQRYKLSGSNGSLLTLWENSISPY